MFTSIRRPHAALPFFLLASVPGAAFAQWVSFTDETASHLTLATVPTNDGEEKDIDLADLDRDGDLDIVVVRKRPFSSPGPRGDLLLMNEGGALVDRTAEFGFDAGPSDARDVLCVDVDGDGWLDVVICTTFEDPIRLYMNRGDDGGGNWLGLADESAARLGPISQASRKYCAVGAGDVDGDGAPDLFFSNYDGGDDLLYINDGAGRFTDQTQARMGDYANSGFGTSNVIVDLDGDGDNDIIKLTTLFSAPPFGLGIYVLWNDGTGTFDSVPFQEINATSPYMFLLADFSGDGTPDMYVVNDTDDQVFTTTGVAADSEWSFSIATPAPAPRTTGFGGNLRAADIDGDGDIDIGVGPIDTDIANCGSSRTFCILRNDGGALSDPVPAAGPQNYNIEPHDFAFLDLNNDGCLDIFMGLCNGYRVFIQSNCQAGCNAADIVAPFGVLDLLDVQAFIGGFPSQDPIADIAEPFGVWDLNDVQAFIAAFSAGCP